MDSFKKAQVKVLDNCRVSPPPGSVPASLLPLTYFDVLCAGIPPVKRLFLYTFPCSTADFLNLHVPNLKRSLSLTLQHFFPLAGNLVAGDAVQNISYAEGDSVAVTVAESCDSLPDLVGNHPRDIQRFRCLVSELPTCDAEQPVLALRVTVFPGRGIGVGLTTHHAAVDGSTITHFVKTWASINTRQGDSCFGLGDQAPLIDRSVVQDRERLLDNLLERFRSLDDSEETFRRVQRDTTGRTDMVRATFVLTRADLDGIRRWTIRKASIACSDFVLVLAVLWVCIAKTDALVGTDDDGAAIEGFGFFADCRGRRGSSVPANYFGNCLTPCIAQVRRSDLLGHEGMATAAKAIWNKIQELKAEDTEPIGKDMIPIIKRIRTMQSVAGSPRLGVYKVDFGWGRPRKVEVVSIDTNCAVSLAENEGAGGGIEVGMALPMEEMDKFDPLFQDLVQKLQAIITH